MEQTQQSLVSPPSTVLYTVDHSTARSDAVPATNKAVDGLRAFAILAVMAVHAGVPGAAVGWIGVDLFFALSGFLITTLLVAEHSRNGKISLGRFWARRFLRLMPAYWLYAGALSFAFWGLELGWREPHGGFSPNAYMASVWFYFVNYAPQGGIWEFQQLTLHLWSLAVEEQFYLLWPLLCAGLLGRKWLEPVAWLLCAVTLGRLLLAPNPLARLDARGFAIIFGCATALRLSASAEFSSRLRTRGSWLAYGVLSILGVMTVLAETESMSELQLHRYVAPIACVLFALLVAYLWVAPNETLGRLLSYRPIAYIGRISYGLYLYHMIAHHLTWYVLLDSIDDWNKWPKFAIRLIVYSALTLAIAALSFHAFEERFLALKRKFR